MDSEKKPVSPDTKTERLRRSTGAPIPPPEFGERDTAPLPRSAPVGISPKGGAYASSVTVSLSCASESAVIRYTLDGTSPGETSPLYDPHEGLLLRESATLRARSFESGLIPGLVSLAEFEVRAAVWQENEPEDRADEVPHTIIEGTREPGGWRLAGASVRGRLHAHRALWREDAFAFAAKGGWTIVAVSDGAGSVPLSRVGARLGCESAVAHLKASLEGFSPSSEDKEGLTESELPALQGFLAGAAGAALAAIRRESAARERPPEEFAATLLVVVHRLWRGRRLIGALQVGDGCVALLDWDDGVTLLGVADHGEHSSETRFLTTQGVEETFPNRVFFSVKDRLRCIAAMTDGVSDDFFPEKKRIVELLLGEELPGMRGRDGQPVRGVMRSVAGAEDPHSALLEWLRYEKRGSSDDRTLVLFWDDEG